MVFILFALIDVCILMSNSWKLFIEFLKLKSMLLVIDYNLRHKLWSGHDELQSWSSDIHTLLNWSKKAIMYVSDTLNLVGKYHEQLGDHFCCKKIFCKILGDIYWYQLIRKLQLWDELIIRCLVRMTWLLRSYARMW